MVAALCRHGGRPARGRRPGHRRRTIAINQANPTFNGFNFTVESVLGDNETQFIDGLDDATGSLRWLSIGTLGLALAAALLVLLGFQARINEYD